MRNGNFVLVFVMVAVLIVLILPMRNGNLDDTAFCDNAYFGSYPTYEEWKLSFSNKG